MESVLALDVGDVRIGIAGSDPLGITAQPIETLTRKKQAEDAKHVLEIAKRRGAGTLVIGLPLNMDGSAGAQAEVSLRFAQALKKLGAPPIRLLDERLTTRAAHRTLMEGGMRREKRKGVVDQLAAVYILQTYLAAPHQGRDLEEYL